MNPKRCYGTPPPGVNLEKLTGTLIVIEGPDSSGRSTQIRLLSTWLEENGHAVVSTGLTRSKLVGPALDRAKEGNVLSPRTTSLFYSTDFYDQLENSIVPALQAGYIVLADRYVFTLIARDLVRGAEFEWLTELYSKAIIPDAVYFLMSTPKRLVERSLTAGRSLDYWESGMDLGISRDWHESFVRYQKKLRLEFNKLQKTYGFETVNASRSIKAIQRDLRHRIESVLSQSYVIG